MAQLTLRQRRLRRARSLAARPHTRAARHSRVLRRYLDRKGQITPHFSWAEMACKDGTRVPRHLRRNAIRHCFNLERLRHELGGVSISIDGPFRTPAHNRAVGGASDSRHLYADASDHFIAQVNRWITESPTIGTRAQLLALCDRIFAKGGVGSENSGTLHLDSRGWRARFVTWVRTK